MTSFYNSDLEITEDGQAVIPQELLDATMEDYFGKTYAVSDAGELDVATTMVTVAEDGNVLLQLGDWGTKGPKFEILEISPADDNSGDVVVVAEYGYYELELGEDELTGYTVTYRLAQKEGTKYGFVITDMKAEQK